MNEPRGESLVNSQLGEITSHSPHDHVAEQKHKHIAAYRVPPFQIRDSATSRDQEAVREPGVVPNRARVNIHTALKKETVRTAEQRMDFARKVAAGIANELVELRGHENPPFIEISAVESRSVRHASLLPITTSPATSPVKASRNVI